MQRIVTFLIFTLFSRLILFGQSSAADITYSIKGIFCIYYSVDFYYNAPTEEEVDSCCWIFGDGVSKRQSTEYRSASHRYSNPGTYTVILKLWKDGIERSIIKEDLIWLPKPPSPRIEFTFQDSNGYAPALVKFKNATVLGDCDTVSYFWNFGDGHGSKDINPEHIFNKPQTYDVMLEVVDTLGCTKTDYQEIVVKDTAQQGEFEFINPECLMDSEIPSYGYNQFYKLSNDSLIIYGVYSGNCGTRKTATIRYNADTIKIKTWEVGPIATCNCSYYFEISIPNIINDSVNVLFNGKTISSTRTNVLEQKIDDVIIEVFPNPANNYLMINIDGSDLPNFDFKILDTEGRIVKVGTLKGDSQIELGSVESGFYMLCISARNKEYIMRFIKE